MKITMLSVEVVIGTAAQDLANLFEKASFMPAFQIYLLKFLHLTRILWVTVAWFIGFWLFIFSYGLIGSHNSLGFGISLIATLIIGAFTTVGEVTIMGFLKAFPPKHISGWCSGTGIAGITGAGVYLIFKSLELEFTTLCYLLMPLSIVYFLTFRHVLDLKAEVENVVKDNQELGIEMILIPHPDNNIQILGSEAAEAAVNHELTIEVAWTVMDIVAKWEWMPIMCQLSLMLWVGITAGISYGNCFFVLLENKRLKHEQKELAINICGFGIEIGTLAAAFFALFISNIVITD